MISFRSEGGFLDTLMRHHSDAFDSQCMERAFYGQQSGFAHQMTVPDSFGSMIKLQRVGGMAYTSKNLFNGVLERGYYDASGGYISSSAAYISDYIRIDGKTVTFSAKLAKSGDALRITAFDANKAFIERKLSGGSDESLVYSNPKAMYLRICVFAGNYNQNTMQLEYGSVATEYEPYYTGIRHTPVTAIESKGKNLFNSELANRKVNGLTILGDAMYVTVNGTKIDGQAHPTIATPNLVLPVGTYTLSCKIISGNIDLSNTSSTNIFAFGINTSEYYTSHANAVGDVGTKTFTITEPLKVTNFSLKATSGGGAVFTDVVLACQLERASAVTDFQPYIDDRFSIPEVIRNESGYGLGVSEDVHNYIDFDKGQYVQMCDIDGEGNVYPLDNPIITDIARYLTAMTSLNVVSGGTLTFVNEYSQAVPFTVGYKIT